MEPKLAYDLIRTACRQREDLRWREWTPDKIKEARERERALVVHFTELEGFCYIATEVFCAMIPEAQPWCASDRMHFWAQVGEVIWDPTWDQFEEPYDYSKGRQTRFKQFSVRATALLEETMTLKAGTPREAQLMGGVPRMWPNDDASA